MGMTWSNPDDIPPNRRDGWIVALFIALSALGWFL